MTPTLRRFAVLSSLSLLALAAACGGKPEAKSAPLPARKIQACSLLTEADATAALQEPVNAMSSVLAGAKGNDPLQCTYNGGISDPPKIVNLLVRPSESAETARPLFTSKRAGLASLNGASPQDVPGLGDAAFWVGGQLNQLHLLKTELHLILTV